MAPARIPKAEFRRLSFFGSAQAAGIACPKFQRVSPYTRKEHNALIKYWMVGIGGFLGSVLRFWMGSLIGERFGARFPYGTFVINVTGSFLVGMVVTVLATKAHWNTNWRYLIPIGFIGGYTTFSTFEFETMRLVQEGQMLMATLNVTLSVALGFVGVWAGMAAGRVIP